MEVALEALSSFLQKDGINLTIVNKTKRGKSCDVAFEAPHLESKRAFHAWIRKEPTDAFFMDSVKQKGNLIKANVIPKSVLIEVNELAKKIGNQLEEVVQDSKFHFMDETETEVFNLAIGEMYEMADFAEGLSYQTFSPYHDTIGFICEFKTATNLVFTTYEEYLNETAQNAYISLIDLIDRIS